MFRQASLSLILIAASACADRPAVIAKAQIKKHFYQHEDAFRRLGEALDELEFEPEQYACSKMRTNRDPSFTDPKHLEIDTALAPKLSALSFPNGGECVTFRGNGRYWMRGVHVGHSRIRDINYSLVYSRNPWNDVPACGKENPSKFVSSCISELEAGWVIHELGINRKLQNLEFALYTDCIESGKPFETCEQEGDERISQMMAD